MIANYAAKKSANDEIQRYNREKKMQLPLNQLTVDIHIKVSSLMVIQDQTELLVLSLQTRH